MSYQQGVNQPSKEITIHPQNQEPQMNQVIHFKKSNMNPIQNFVDMNEQMQINYQESNMNKMKQSIKNQQNPPLIQLPQQGMPQAIPQQQGIKLNQIMRGTTNNNLMDPNQLSQNQNVHNVLSKASDNQQLPQYYGRIKKKSKQLNYQYNLSSRLLKIYKERFIFIHNGYLGYVKSRGGQNTKFLQKHQPGNSQGSFSYNVTWKQFKQDFSQSILNFVKIEDLKISQPEGQKPNQYFFEIFFPTSKLVNEQKNIELMNFHQLESEYVSEQQGQVQNNDNLSKETPNTTIWYFQANTLNQLTEIKKCINDTKNPPNQQQNKEAEKKVRDLEKEQREKMEQYKKNQEEGLKILQEERRKMEENEKQKKEQMEKEMEEFEKKKMEQQQLQKELEEQDLKLKLENLKIGEKQKVAWNFQWMRCVEENTHQTLKIQNVFQKSQFMIHSQMAFTLTCKNLIKDIIFNKALKEEFQTITPLTPAQIKLFDPQLAQLCSQKDSFVKCYHQQNILFKVVYTTSSSQSTMIDYVIKQFKKEFKNYNKLNDDIFEILKYDDYFHLRTPQNCYLEFAGFISLCVAIENINLKPLQKQERIYTLQYDEKTKLQEELNPIYRQKSIFQNRQEGVSSIKQQQNIQKNPPNQIEDPEEKRYEEMLKQMMKEEFNITLSEENTYKMIGQETEESQNDIANKIEVSQIISSLAFHQRKNNKKIILEQDFSNYILYLLDDNLYDSFRKFNELIGLSNIYPKHTKTVIVQFKLPLNYQIQVKNSLLVSDKKEENTFSFNVYNPQNANSLLKSNDNRSQKSQQSMQSLLNSQFQQSLQIDQNPMEKAQKELMVKQFVSDIQDLKLYLLEPEQFRQELKKYGIKCNDLNDLIPTLQFLLQGKQHVYVQIISRIVKKQFRQYMYCKINEFSQSLGTIHIQIQMQQQKIKEIEQKLNIAKQKAIVIQDEEILVQKQIESHVQDWQKSEQPQLKKLEELKNLQQSIQADIELIKQSLQEESNFLQIMINGDPEEEQIKVHQMQMQEQNDENNTNQQAKSPQKQKYLLLNKSQSLYSTTFSLKDLEGNNISQIRAKFDLYLIESIRQFVKQIYYDYHQQTPEQSYWEKFIHPILQLEKGMTLQKELIPQGMFFQELCKQIGIDSKPSEKIKLFDFQNSQSIISLKPYVKLKNYQMRSSTIYKLDEEFDKNLSSHLFNVTQSTIDLKYKILAVYHQVIDELTPPQEGQEVNDKQQQQIVTGQNVQNNEVTRKIEQQILLFEIKQLYQEHLYSQLFEYQQRVNQLFYPLQIEKQYPLILFFQSYIHIGNIHKAEEIFSQIRVLIDYNYGKDHINLLVGLEELSKFYIKKKQYAQGLTYYLETEQILTKFIGYNHPKTALCSSVIAELYLKIGNEDQSLSYYERSLDQYIDHGQTQLRSIISILLKLSEMYYEKNQLTKVYEKATLGIESYYKYKVLLGPNQEDATFNLMFLKLIHISMKLMVDRQNFEMDKIKQYSQDFWLICLEVDIQSYHEIVEECLMLCLLLNLIEVDYKERHYFIELIKEINLFKINQERESNKSEVNLSSQADRINIDFKLFQKEIKANPLIDQLISTILRIYQREINLIKPYFDAKIYLENCHKDIEYKNNYPQILNKVIYFAEIFRNVMGVDNTELFLSFDFDFQKFM